MSRAKTAFALLVVFFAGPWRPRAAYALGPIDLEVALKGGMGTAPGGDGNGPNPLGIGIGARAGVAFSGLYGGIAVMSYAGEKKTETRPCVVTVTGCIPAASTASISAHALLYGVEAGYGVRLGPHFLLRALVGVGDYAETVDVSGNPSAAAFAQVGGTRNSLYVAPGLIAMFPFARLLFAAAGASVLLLPNHAEPGAGSSFDAAFTARGEFGLKF